MTTEPQRVIPREKWQIITLSSRGPSKACPSNPATSGIHGIALTKLDILDALKEIKICVGYRLDGREIDYLPASERAQAEVEPIYETIAGWKGATAGARSWADLPAQAIKYVRRIEELVGCPVALLSTSPEREDTILMQNPFEA